MTSKEPLPGTLEGIADLMRSDGKLATFTQSYRMMGDKTFKNESPLFAVACLMEGGKAKENVRQLTGMSLVDFDHVVSEERRGKSEESNGSEELRTKSEESNGSEERRGKSEESNGSEELRVKSEKSNASEEVNRLKAKLIADPHTLMCYTTISGNGLRVIFKYELPPDRQEDFSLFTRHSSLYYQSAFFTGNTYYEKLISCKADPQCKNITRLSCLAHDPEVFLNPDAVPFTAEEIDHHIGATAKEDKEQKQLKRIEDYYRAEVVQRLESDGIKFQPGSHNEYVMRTGYMLAKKRYSRRMAMKWAKEKFREYDDTEQVFKSCFDAYAKEVVGSGQGGGGDGKQQFASVEEIKSFLDGHVSLRFNEITLRVEIQQSDVWLPINDRIVNSLWSQMSATFRVNVQDMYRVIESDYVPIFNPFVEYLNSLPEWHEGDHDYIADLAATVKVKGEPPEEDSSLFSLPSSLSKLFTFRSSLKKWLVGMVAAWLSDDVVNNVILVLIGEQGAYKTTWFSCLLPPQLRQYFYVKTNANRLSKDDLLTLAQYGLVCCEELDTMRPAELNQLKAAVTMPSIDERAAYAHFHEHRKHIASFCGTGNNLQFLSDPTGNRRWLPFEVENIVSPRDHPFDYEGIYAQAYALYRGGFRYWFTQDEVRKQNNYNRLFEIPHLERELVDLYFRLPQEGENGEFVSAARALQLISFGISQKLNSVEVSRAFVELGFRRVRTKKSRGYLVVCRTAEEMKSYQKTMALDAEDDE